MISRVRDEQIVYCHLGFVSFIDVAWLKRVKHLVASHVRKERNVSFDPTFVQDETSICKQQLGRLLPPYVRKRAKRLLASRACETRGGYRPDMLLHEEGSIVVLCRQTGREMHFGGVRESSGRGKLFFFLLFCIEERESREGAD